MTVIVELISLADALRVIPRDDFWELVETGAIREVASRGLGAGGFDARDVRRVANAFPDYVPEPRLPRAQPIVRQPPARPATQASPAAADARLTGAALVEYVDRSIERRARAEGERRAALTALRAPGNGAIVHESLADPGCTVNMAKAKLYDAAAEIRRNAGREAAAQTRALAKTPASIAPTTDPARLAGRAAARAFAAVPGPSRLPRA